MSEFRTVASVSELPPGQMRRVIVDGKRVVLANAEGQICALADECGHQKAALSKGKLDGSTIECPLHFARFDARTGKVVSGPDFSRIQIPGLDTLGPEAMAAMQRTGELLADVDTADVPVYEVRLEGDSVQVRV
ncbi:MAG TPA: Rieske 2Fe-2S domain-containing protein [Dehalococcoidia bacterium]|nr:Rieske 2Fe-2S domain-containing protein [Dehalococcoidia bacterium]